MLNNKLKESIKIGTIIKINSSVITATGFKNQFVGEMVEIGEDFHLKGEILKIIGENTIIICYEETEGLRLYDKVFALNQLLSMKLGPGLLGNVYDGIQRPLQNMADISGPFISRGIKTEPLDVAKYWDYIGILKEGDHVSQGDIIGSVKEIHIDHKILIPKGVSGTVFENSDKSISINEPAYSIKTDSGSVINLPMYQIWPIRLPRPYIKRFIPKEPLITGLRVFDLLFPTMKGGVGAIPGGFGTGKTVVLQNLSEYSNAEIIIYIGCGERGNEIADLLSRFVHKAKSEDGEDMHNLMARTVMIANTSNMPVAAREASIYTGITLAEYWRDQGKDVLLLADSTSRWAEALRELSGRLEEMPTEGGYPAYLGSRIGSFYERGGYIQTLGNDERYGSISIVGAVSPQGGDFSEPVTNSTKKFIKTFWALDPQLAYARHYPSVNWTESYSQYLDNVKSYWESRDDIKNSNRWDKTSKKFLGLLAQADQLSRTAQIIGKENMPIDQQLHLFIIEIIKEGLLIQNSFNANDSYSSIEKTLKIADIISDFYKNSQFFVEQGIPLSEIAEMDCVVDIRRMRLDYASENFVENIKVIEEEILESFKRLERRYSDHLKNKMLSHDDNELDERIIRREK